ncbi:hypothetical protein F0562_033743 [Nyssa sinensis]|uniref:WRKY domain-containing protein n=1 Tax=Nyssa sinensis TaxID=561372 RepID=A0A5J5AH53_9ASTE|nr:hypothetical protein F0562_033743 [Nyssa sinensis]
MIKFEKTISSDHGDEDSVLTEINKVGHVKHVEEEDNTSKPSSPNGNDLCIENQVLSLTTTERSSMETSPQEYSCAINENQENKLKSAKAQMGEVREENERLKLTLSQIMKEYQSLQMHFQGIVQQEEAMKSRDTAPSMHPEDEEPELVSLSLGRASSEPKNKDEIKKTIISNSSKGKEDDKFDEGLKLGLDCRFDLAPTELTKNPSSENSFEESKEDPTETWPPNKNLKTVRSGDDDIQENPMKKARVSIRATCDTSTVQRCAEDMSILITTYEGTHNHPLPVSATAMASTTSAAASMLKSASSSSQPGLGISATTTTSTTANLHGLNFMTLPNNSRPIPFYFPNSTISTSQSHPTITLDLTAPPTSSPFNRPPSSSFPSAPRYSTSLNFSSSSSSSLIPNTLQTSWANNYLSYGTMSHNRNHIGSSYLTRHQPYTLSNNSTQPLTETISAATKAITSNPTFQSALAAAITSFVGNAGASGVRENQGGVVENSGQKVKLGECFLPVNNGFPPAHNGIGCATSYLNRLPPSKSQQGSFTLFPPSLPFSTYKSPSESPPENGDHIK